MDVRVCPKCGMENKRSSSSCANCFTSLARVPVTQSGGAGQTSSQPPAGVAQTQMGGPPRGPSGGQPYGQPQGQPQGQSYNQQMYPIDQMPKKTPLAWVFVLFGILVVAGIAISIPMMLKAVGPKPKPKEPPTNVVMQYLEAKRTNQLEDVKPYLSKDSIKMLESAFSSRQARSAGFDINEVAKMFVFNVSPTAAEIRKCDITLTVVPDEEDKSGDTAVVLAKLTKKAVPGSSAQAQPQGESASAIDFDFSSGEGDYEFVLVNEEAKWKLDLPRTNKREGVNSQIGNFIPKN